MVVLRRLALDVDEEAICVCTCQGPYSPARRDLQRRLGKLFDSLLIVSFDEENMWVTFSDQSVTSF